MGHSNEFNLECKKCKTTLNMTWNYCPICGEKTPWFDDNDKNTKDMYSQVIVNGQRTSIFKKDYSNLSNAYRKNNRCYL